MSVSDVAGGAGTGSRGVVIARPGRVRGLHPTVAFAAFWLVVAL